MSYLAPVLQLLLAVITLTGGIWDLRTRRIPNWLVLAGFLSGLGLNWFLFGTAGLWMALKGFGLALAIYFPLFALRAMGAGDAKLMGAVGSIVGPGNWLGIFLLTSILGGLAGLVILLLRRRLASTMWNVSFILAELSSLRLPYLKREELAAGHQRAISLPHGLVIASACMLFLVALNIWAPR